MIYRICLAQQKRIGRFGIKRGQQAANRGKIKFAVAPVNGRDSRKAMGFNLVDNFLLKGRTFLCHAKGAICHMPAGTTGNLGNFRGRQMAHALPVKFGIFCQCDMRDIHIQPHADCICGYHKINIAILVQFNLCIAGTRAERTHHNRRPATLPPDKLCQPVHISGREGHNRRAALQARHLFLASIA